MSKHTPAPWRKCGGATPHYTGIHSCRGYIVFGLADYQTTREHGNLIECPGYEEQEANARLIAAAPDLLEACERAEKLLDALLSFYGLGLDVINWHKNGDAEPLDNFIDDNSDGSELTALRAAIAKAKGEPAP